MREPGQREVGEGHQGFLGSAVKWRWIDGQELATLVQQEKMKGSRQRKQSVQRPGGRVQQDRLEQLNDGQMQHGWGSGECMKERLGEVGGACGV